MTAQEEADKNRDSIKKTIQSSIPQINKDAEAFKLLISEERFLEIDSDINEVLRDLRRLEFECNEIIARKKKNNEYQRTLDMDMTPFANVDEIALECSLRCSLWRSIYEWKDLVD
jgi:hypothetical protein